MRGSVSEVLGGQARWAVGAADCIDWLESLPDDSIDLLFTSPPYLHARTYGIDAGRGLEEWVDWMVRLFRAAAPKVKGLVAVVCEGQTRNYAYQPAPMVLMARLFLGGFNLRKPPVFHRCGIPGSGGPDWLRNDWEPVVCVTRKGRLPWSDPTALGGPAKYDEGGRLSHRNANGERVNVESKKTERTLSTVRKGRLVHHRDAKGFSPRVYRHPERCNPGNVLKFNVGGGRMGHPLCHENEAPFPLALAEFFIKSFCPPDGVVADCFAGSCTTGHAAFAHGRRFVGCDLRDSQADLSARRLLSVEQAMKEAANGK